MKVEDMKTDAGGESGASCRARNFPSRLFYPLLLVVVLAVFFLCLEYRYPYYFLQDDNRNFFMPLFVHSYRSLCEGELPFFNFHQFLGHPLLSSGQSASLYPPVHISLFLSKLFFGHFFAAVDILVCLHLVIAGLGLFGLLKFLKLSDRGAFFGAITWPLTSIIIYTSSAWHHTAVCAAFFPLMLYFSLRLYGSWSTRNFFFLVVIRVLFFYMGYVQLFIYAVFLEALTFLVAGIALKIKGQKRGLPAGLLYYCLSYAATTVLSLPLLLPMWHQMTISATRQSAAAWEVFSSQCIRFSQWLAGLLYAPFTGGPPADIPLEGYWIDSVGQYFSYVGYVSLPAIVFCLVYLLKPKKPRNGTVTPYILVFLIMAAVSLLWTTGGLNRLIYIIPILNRFRWHFRINIFTTFYLVVLAAMGLSLFLECVRFSGRAKSVTFTALMVVQICTFFYLYLSSPQKNIPVNPEKIPLKEPRQEALRQGRILSLRYSFLVPSLDGTFGGRHLANGICCNYATLWELYHVAGYDNFVIKDNYVAALGMNGDASYDGPPEESYINYFRLWGVKWYVVRKKANVYDGYLTSNGILRRFDDAERTIYYDAHALPFFFWAGSQSTEGIDERIGINSITVKTSNKAPNDLVINFLCNPFFTAELDGGEIPIDKNQHGQMVIHVPAGDHTIEVKYSDPYFFFGCYIVLICAVVLAGGCLMYRYYPAKRKGVN